MKPLTRKEILLDKIANSNLGVSGTKNITENGDYDVARFASAHVAVPAGITPTGNIEITENGENINVAPYATATVNVSGGGGGDALPFCTITVVNDYADQDRSIADYISATDMTRQGGITLHPNDTVEIAGFYQDMGSSMITVVIPTPGNSMFSFLVNADSTKFSNPVNITITELSGNYGPIVTDSTKPSSMTISVALLDAIAEKPGGNEVEVPEPQTREEYFLKKIVDNASSGGGGGETLPYIAATVINELSKDVNLTGVYFQETYGVGATSPMIPANSTETVNCFYEFDEDTYFANFGAEGTEEPNPSIQFSDLINCTISQYGFILITDPSQNASVTITVSSAQ